MARATVAYEEAFLGWLFLFAVVGVAGAAVGLGGGASRRRLTPCLHTTPGPNHERPLRSFEFRGAKQDQLCPRAEQQFTTAKRIDREQGAVG